MTTSAGLISEDDRVLLPAVPTRAQIETLEDAMADSSYPKIEFKTEHLFAAGLYGRRITIPAGALLTGKVHKCEHFNVVERGLIDVWTEDGMKRVGSGTLLVSRPGAKRVGRAILETVWTTIHANPTGETDPDKLEALLVEPNRPELLAKLSKPCLS